jgi:hypothetical protein
MHANFFSFELLYLVLRVDIVSGVASGILQHILVTRFHDRTRENLDSGLLRLSLRIRRLSRLVRCLPGLLLLSWLLALRVQMQHSLRLLCPTQLGASKNTIFRVPLNANP